MKIGDKLYILDNDFSDGSATYDISEICRIRYCDSSSYILDMYPIVGEWNKIYIPKIYANLDCISSTISVDNSIADCFGVWCTTNEHLFTKWLEENADKIRD
jgi:hypothetical protein